MHIYTSEINDEIEKAFRLKPKIWCNEDQYGTIQNNIWCGQNWNTISELHLQCCI